MMTTTISAAIVLTLALPLNCLQVRTAPPSFSLHRGSGRGVVRVPPSLQSRRRRRQTALPDSFVAPPSSSSSPTALHLLKGLVPTIDDDIEREVQDAKLSSLEVFQRELDNGASLFAAIAAVRRRSKDKSGDYENKYKILADYRSYSNRELLDTDHVGMAPTLDDLNQIQPGKWKVLWVTAPYRLAVFVGAFFSFPLICTILSSLVEITQDEFDIISDQFTPGIGILYGTFVALTLDILYERQGKVQENASVEASLLSQVTQNVLNLFRDDQSIAREATQIIADQVRIIVYRSRGSEMLSIMRADPYARLLSIVDRYQKDKKVFTPHEEALIDGLRSEIPALMEARAKRLSDEASALPPTHFQVLLILTVLSLTGFTAATLTITDVDGEPPLESRMVFAALTAVYTLFFNFCQDMNDPFDGVYQIKRSSAASYLLQIKWLISNQPFGADIRFDTRGLAPVYDGSDVCVIGEGCELFEDVGDGVSAYSGAELVENVVANVDELQAKTIEVNGINNEEPFREQVVAPSVEMTPTGASIATGISESERVSIDRPTPAAADFIPTRAEVAAREEMKSQFDSLSGFSSDGSTGGEGVTVPTSNAQKATVDRQKISMYFRRTGGFGG